MNDQSAVIGVYVQNLVANGLAVIARKAWTENRQIIASVARWWTPRVSPRRNYKVNEKGVFHKGVYMFLPCFLS